MRLRMNTYTVALASALVLTSGAAGRQTLAVAQAAAAPARQIGTVKAIAGDTLTLATDGGAQVSVSVAEGARVLQLAPGSTDLKSAQQIAFGDIAVGDRVLVTGKAGDDGSLTATRVVLMKSTDIAQKNEAEKTDWQRRGLGGLVSAVNGSTITLSSGTKKIQVDTTATTKFRRYGADSVKFEDAKPGTLDQIRPGDQLRVRGNKSEDGTSIQAEEIVSGSFKNLAGTVSTLDAAGGVLTLKDLATKRTMTINVTSNSDLRKLPPEMAARFAARAHSRPAGEENGNGTPSADRTPGGDRPMREGGMAGPARSAGGDLSQMLARLPTETLKDLKPGDAVMVVASEPSPGSNKVTAVTMLSGVEPILAATPSGSPAMTLSPWNVGGGAEAAGAGSPQ